MNQKHTFISQIKILKKQIYIQ